MVFSLVSSQRLGCSVALLITEPGWQEPCQAHGSGRTAMGYLGSPLLRTPSGSPKGAGKGWNHGSLHASQPREEEATGGQGGGVIRAAHPEALFPQGSAPPAEH